MDKIRKWYLYTLLNKNGITQKTLKPPKTYLFFDLFCFRTFCFSFLLGIQVSIGQVNHFSIPDSLVDLDYNQVYRSYLKTWKDTLRSQTYLYTCLKKSIEKNDPIKMAQAYCMLSYYAKNESEKISLLDQSIDLSIGLEDKIYPTEAYSFKGGHYLRKGDFISALDNYLMALRHAEKTNNIEYIYITKHNIALIKTDIGKYDEALPLFRDNFRRNSTRIPMDTVRYLKSSIVLAESYRYTNKLDSASMYYQKGESLLDKKKHHHLYGTLVLNEGINLFYKKKYRQAYDSISKGISLLDKNSISAKRPHILGEFYLGKLRALEKNKMSALSHFHTVDSIIQQEQITFQEVREGYEYIINFYKQTDKKERQLHYINNLLKFDSINTKKTSFMSSKLFKEFDTPLLLKEKETLIRALKGNNKNLNLIVIFLTIITAVSSVFLFTQYQKRKTYQQKFEQLIDKNTRSKTPQKKPQGEIGVPDLIVQEILQKLNRFEKNKQFLKKNISTASLAKDIKTNTKYLSKVINYHKHKNFANYINDLRIEHAVIELKKNSTLKQYTIQGIAEEMGFNTAESFSSAFKKSTGIKTSYFIKKLNELDTQ
ncbi:AraC family transcriptional regulator [Aquimarina pacifica]|uniref:AraC family transcriptional regulator n=1 Tax=Aquimarina pacifica TaxID=1296415 RepID=UPI00047208BB|nr:AraC family transcriptional regulator [Aquimarina pacifica]